jgi:hypothetical protein
MGGCALVYTRPDTLGEEDEYRITPGDERTRRELINYLQRMKLHEESLLQIRKVREQWAITTRQNGGNAVGADEDDDADDGGGVVSAASPARLRKTVSAASLLFCASSAAKNAEREGPQGKEAPAIYLKLEGMALLQLRRDEESRALLQQYIDILLRREVRVFDRPPAPTYS